jgi:MscS family membrane protein
VFAYVDSRARLEFLAIREEIFLRMMDLIDAAGTGFAFPSQTHYLAQDPGLPAASPRPAALPLRRSPDFPPADPETSGLAAAKR